MSEKSVVPFVLFNPHVGDWLAEPLSFRLLRRRPLKKYGYLIGEPKRLGMRVPVLICGTLSGIVPQQIFSYLPEFVRSAWLSFELKAWQRINDVGHLDFYFRPEDVPNPDILLMSSRKNCEGPGFYNRLEIIKRFRTVVANMSHYFVNTSEKADKLEEIPNVTLWSESDISSNPYFRHFFDWYKKPVFVVPFCVGERFVQLYGTRISRSSKCVATGSFHFLPDEKPRSAYEDFMHFFGATNYHFLRNDLYQRKQEPDIEKHITVLTSPYREKKSAFGWLQRILGASQKRYFSVNMVNEYHSHVFAVVGEERSGNPGIGIFEAMGCGTVPIVNMACYEGLGMSVGENCLQYDGSVDGLLKAVNEDSTGHDLQVLERNAAAYVEDNCRPKRVYEKFLAAIYAVREGV